MPPEIDQTLALPGNEFFPAQHAKTGICLHHTVGGTAASSINFWKTDGANVGTAYMIGRDGTVFEIFDPKAWAFQFGLKGWSNTDRFSFEKRFIGIEIASEGGLTESDGNLYCFDRVSPRT
ncbi:MAG: N-acetylmuramoyl-L-alanine amidase, partial [Rhodothermia bacterium]